jgi:hypothetical protein
MLLVYSFLTVSGFAQEIKPKVKIGKDTTYIDGPLTEDGYVDYLGGLNQILSKGVTPENNAAVLLLQVSPTEFRGNEKYLKHYCKALGIKLIPLQGDYFQTLKEFSDQEVRNRSKGASTSKQTSELRESIQKDYATAGAAPWKKEEIPSMAKWVKGNERHLALLQKASMRSHYYHPMLDAGDGEGPSVVQVLLPQAQQARSFARALGVRSMMYLGEGEITKCTKDLIAIRRLGNHIAKGATLVEQLVGIAIVGLAQNLEQKMALSERLSTKQLLEYRRTIDQNRVQSSMVRAVSGCERFMYLDCVQYLMKGGFSDLNGFLGLNDSLIGSGKEQTLMQELVDKFVSQSTDWSFTMKLGNQVYDKYEKTFQKTTDWIEQQKALKEIEKEIQQLAKTPTVDLLLKGLLGGPEVRGEIVGQFLVGLVLPAFSAAASAEKRAQVMDDLSFIVISAAAHKIEMGDYPTSINGFSKKIVGQLPIDRYAKAAYHYRREGKGFVVYSVGPNQKDEQGNGVYNERHSVGDDYGAGYESVPLNLKNNGLFR